MNSKKYVLPAFAAVFALMFAAATPYVIAEPGQEKDWSSDYHGDYAKKDIRQDMAEKLNSYCEMSAEEQAELIEKYDKTEEVVTKMNEYCSLDEAGKQAFIEEHKDEYKKHLGDNMRKQHGDYNKKHHMTIEIQGFTGSIPIPDMSDVEDKKAAHEELKSKIVVKLSEAAAVAENAGLDVMKGSIGMAVNENDEKFVVWILAEMNMDSAADDSDTMSENIFVVDAVDATITAQTTKEFDHSMKDNRYSHDKQQERKVAEHKNTLSDPEQIENKIAKIEEKLSEGGTGNSTADELKSQFLGVLKQLQTAIADGDDTQADSLREQLNDLRNQMTDMRRHN